jgi:hypothetical protein
VVRHRSASTTWASVRADAGGIAYAVERDWLIISGGLHSVSLTEIGRQRLKVR